MSEYAQPCGNFRGERHPAQFDMQCRSAHETQLLCANTNRQNFGGTDWDYSDGLGNASYISGPCQMPETGWGGTGARVHFQNHVQIPPVTSRSQYDTHNSASFANLPLGENQPRTDPVNPPGNEAYGAQPDTSNSRLDR
jgi:hypothetical protein